MTSASEFLLWLEKEEETTGDQLWKLSQEIWNNPELKFQEHRAHKVLTDFLEEKGFMVERNYLLPTAFKAELQLSGNSESNGPTVGIICEYDALPQIGHSCGHNLIAEIGVATALALKHASEHRKLDSPGKIVVIGTPAEEGGGGKIQMINMGAFRKMDVVLMAHPGTGHNITSTPTFITSLSVDVSYQGRASHAAGKPWEGLNALDAAVACYVNVALLKQQLPPGWKVNGIISKGGEATNVIPRESALKFLLRTPYSQDSITLADRVKKCVYAAGEAHGCQASFVAHWDTHYKHLEQNSAIGERYQTHCQELGLEFIERDKMSASTDFGNVSLVVPGLHPSFGLNTDSFPHMEEFGAVAGTRDAQKPTLKIVAALAATAAELLQNSELVNTAKQIHKTATNHIQDTTNNLIPSVKSIQSDPLT